MYKSVVDQQDRTDRNVAHGAMGLLGLRRRWPRRLAVLAGGAVIVAAGVAAYHNSFKGVFLIDDHDRIVGNIKVRQLWPVWQDGSIWPKWPVVIGPRPVVDFSLAANFAAGGLNVWGYHLVNLVVHLLAALVLYGIVRRTLCRPRLRKAVGRAAGPLALAVALIWTVHPIHTGAVTYVIQRAEAMMGLFYLLTLYCAIRAFSSRHAAGWYAAGVAACVLGVGCKEVIVTAPILVLVYDRIFVARSFREVFRRRWPFHACLWAVPGVLLVLRLSLRDAGPTAGFFTVPGMNPWSYAATQFGVIARYLKLSFWPASLCLDYYWPVVKWWPLSGSVREFVLPALLILGLLAATGVALWRRPMLGFLGLWFFLILAPTSSIMPIKDVIFEHRVYLSLAAVVALVVVGGYALGRRLARPGRPRTVLAAGGTAAAGAVVVALAVVTVQRNKVYSNDRLMYQDIVDKEPLNPRGHRNLGVALVRQNRLHEALRHLTRSIELKWDSHQAHNNYGAAIERLGDLKGAVKSYRIALQMNPNYPAAHGNLGAALGRLKQYDEALEHLKAAIRLAPFDPGPYLGIGIIMAEVGRAQEAAKWFQKVIQLDPKFPKAYYNIGVLQAAQGNVQTAIRFFVKTLQLDPGDADAHFNLATALWVSGQPRPALGHFQQVLKLRPGDGAALNSIARILATYPEDAVRNGPEAVRLAEALCKAVGYTNLDYLDTLAAAYAETGRFADAVRTAQLALQMARQANVPARVKGQQARLALYSAGRPLRGMPDSSLPVRHSQRLQRPPGP